MNPSYVATHLIFIPGNFRETRETKQRTRFHQARTGASRGTIRSLHRSVQRGSVITRIRRAICLSYVKTLLLGVG
jgi:hypothetical protein